LQGVAIWRHATVGLFLQQNELNIITGGVNDAAVWVSSDSLKTGYRGYRVFVFSTITSGSDPFAEF